ncbi:MAG: 50S ribosomal protein L18 [Candidatus Magasanikbacteria bacterium RIFCSPHIGHO2_02_FULL_41_13]|uniref:Large ribosomal subunit protein uL18 n=1 Tax=Candidatus Magasanikbacteria bacterium RIFCSPHIGHO2_02_FULL_41_13 TaxID=1798676 RepID=A0A1F6M4M5_9BACT|nr:MAG: 50S ribosomal protein L18 [Candidatus Magasanikbacteria bacterium RIFCSPHIGHO2_02_FULL_41_13]
MKKLTTRIQKRNRRKARVRARVLGTAERPRLCVFRSLKSLYVQVIDDTKGVTLVGMKSDEGHDLGKKIAEKAIALGIKKVVFDRAGYAYHGRVKAVADGAREGGLEF